MKYFYILCLALSSFFTYKHIFAQEQYAFFIPNNAFQNNLTTEDSFSDDTRKIPEESQPSTSKEPKISRPYVHATPQFIPAQTTKNNQPKDHHNKEPKDSPHGTPFVTYQQPRITDLGAFHSSEQTVDPVITADQLDHYQLETTNSPHSGISSLSSPQPSSTKLDVEDRLNSLPYPDFKLPKFKQLYATYCMELRVLYRQGKLPYNQEQDNTLAKADTIQRFKID
ncbi:hypothetical protein IJ556_05885 [bacterium]|nr:hypothetical protein [bacterium]MBR2274191.1 hypothetical protein [Alphaproteobacteria bacterium]